MTNDVCIPWSRINPRFVAMQTRLVREHAALGIAFRTFYIERVKAIRAKALGTKEK